MNSGLSSRLATDGSPMIEVISVNNVISYNSMIREQQHATVPSLRQPPRQQTFKTEVKLLICSSPWSATVLLSLLHIQSYIHRYVYGRTT